MEDPSEDVFTNRVLADGQNFLIFEGIYESAAFHLQCFLDVLDSMPAEEPYEAVRRSSLALLRISNEVARRAEVKAFIIGETIPLAEVPMKLVRQIPGRAEMAVFTKEELQALDISLDDLKPFIFDAMDSEHLRSQQLGNTSLERKPLLLVNEKIILALPTAVSEAIKRFVIEFCASGNLLRELYVSYADQLSQLFSQTPLVGGATAPRLPFQMRQGIFFANIAKFVDFGRLLHICFVVDDFRGFAEGGLSEPNPESDRISEAVQMSLSHARRELSDRENFKDAIFLVVICSWGRPVVLGFDGVEDERWRVEHISAADLVTLSWSSSFKPLSFWQLLDSQERLKALNLNIVNLNGFLNLQGWADDLRGHLVPHGQIPDDHDPNQMLQFLIPQNKQLDLRKRVVESWDLHYARKWDGRNVRVRRQSTETFFEEDQNEPLYVSVEDLNGDDRLAAVYEASQRSWWVTVDTAESCSRELHYRLFHALMVWLKRAAPVLDLKLQSLPSGPFGWLCSFEDGDNSDAAAPVPDREQASALLSVKVKGNSIIVFASKGFLLSFRNPTNLGEVLLVETLIRGANIISGRDEFEDIEELKAQIVPDEWARDVHFFMAQEFRDFVRTSIRRKPILISDADAAYSKLGLGWRVRDRTEGSWVRGVDECCLYLNRLIESIWEDVRGELKSYSRESLVFTLYENHEATMLETDQWLRTARSVLSFHRDTAKAEAESAMHIAELNASSLSTRLLIEMALCEAPEVGGCQHIGKLDLTRLLTSALQMHVLGGWSEAIKYGGKKPEIKIAPFGDVLTEPDFDDTIATPYGQALGVKRFRLGASGYEQNFNASDVAESAKAAFPVEFWEAWQETFGFSIDDIRVFLDNVDDEGLRRETFAFVSTYDQLVALGGMNKLHPQTVGCILEALVLRPRSSWDTTPSGFNNKDWYPWRFRRRLSLIARPIVELPGIPARYLIAPSMVRNGVVKLIGYCLEGGFDAKDFPSGKMRSWIGAAENKRGHDFNQHVASMLRDLGWQAKSDVKLTEILNSKLDKNYGDVDVLAWKDERILAIECKDLELAMTVGEIARQVHEFRGENVDGKPDRLKKHMNRFDILQSRVDAVRRFTKSPDNAGLEMSLVFSDLVPMNFSNLAKDRNIRIVLADGLGSI